MSSIILFVQTILLCFSIPNTFASSLNPISIKQACTEVPEAELCLQILQSNKRISSAKNSFDQSIAIIESGISDGTNTQKYIVNLLKQGNLSPNLKGALQECKLSYESALGSLGSALTEVKNDHDYGTSTYDLKIAGTDDIGRCGTAMVSKGIKDGTILRGNKAMVIYALAGYNVVEALDEQTYKPPPHRPRSSSVFV